MIELLSRRCHSGDLCINLARRHLGNNEWGLARMALEEGMARGRLSEPDTARELMKEICQRLNISSAIGEQGLITTVMED